MTDVQVELFHEPPGSSSLNGPPFSHFDAEDEPEAALKVHSKPYEEDSLEEGNSHDERSQSPPQEKPLTPPNLSDGEESHKVPERGEEHPQNDMRRQCFTRMVLDTGCDDDDGVITFDAPTLPIIVAKPIQIISPGSPIDSQPKIGTPPCNIRLRNLSLNGHLTLNLCPQVPISPPTAPPPPSSSSPTMGRFTVTTCQPDTAPAPPPPLNGPGAPRSSTLKSPPDPEPPQAPQPKDERLMTPLERLQLYIDNTNMHCRNGVAVQYVNFIKDAEDPEQFVMQSAKFFEKFVQEPDLPMRLGFLEQIPNIVRSYKPSFKKLRMMSFLGDSIRDENYNIRRLAQVAIGQLVEFAPEVMTREVIIASVIPLLRQIFMADSGADLTIDALNLFCKLLDKVGADAVRRLFMPEFSKLCSHEIAQIRQVCAQNMGFVVRYFAVIQSEEFPEDDSYSRILQERILNLAQDFAWHVRETVANIFPHIIDICYKRWPIFTVRMLYPAYMAFLNDQAKQVRRCASRGLGRIIAACADPSKTRLQLTTNGTVEFIPPSTFPAYRLSESEEFDRRALNSLSEGLLHEGFPRRPNIRGSFTPRNPAAAVSSPALSHNNKSEVRRTYYNRLGISLTQALNDADDGNDGKPRRTDPIFNSFRFWQNPIPQVAVIDDKVPVILTESTTVSQNSESSENKEEIEKTDVESEEIISLSEVILQDRTEAEPSKSQKVKDSREDSPLVTLPDVIPAEGDFPSIRTEGDNLSVLTEGDRSSIRTDGDQVISEEDLIDAKVDDAEIDGIPLEGKLVEMVQSGVLEKSVVEKSSAGQDSDMETRSVSSSSSASQDLNGAFMTNPAAQPVSSYGFSYEIDSLVIDKHRRRDRAVMNQLRESSEVASRLEDILPNVQFLREFLILAKDNDREAVIQVAVDFPAVAFTVGRQFWPEIQETHKFLASSTVMQSRELIAASLPRIAEIVGYYHTVVDLVPLLGEFLKDTDSVRLAMIENYSAFITRLPPEVRPMHLLRLCEFFSPDEERNWRYRFACTEQIAHLAALFPPKLVVRTLMDAGWFFAKDRIAEVRKNSCLALSAIFRKIEQQRDVESRKIFLQKLTLFLGNEDFRARQVFAQICQDLLAKAALSFDSFSLYFGDRFWPLFDDNVVAVRLAAARCLIHFPLLGRRQMNFAMAVNKLQMDPSRSVQEVYSSILSPPVTPPLTAGLPLPL